MSHWDCPTCGGHVSCDISKCPDCTFQVNGIGKARFFATVQKEGVRMSKDESGSAFPHQEKRVVGPNERVMNSAGGVSYHPGDTWMLQHTGLTKRELFAAVMAAAFIVKDNKLSSYTAAALAGIEQADALLAELARRGE